MPRRIISLFFKVMTGVTISISVSGRVPRGSILGRPGNIPAGSPDSRSCLPLLLRCRSLLRRSLPPAHRHGKKMRIPEGDIRYGNRTAVRTGRTQFIFRNGNVLVRERRTANRAKMIELHDSCSRTQ